MNGQSAVFVPAMSLKGFAACVGVGIGTIENWQRQGLIRTIRLGGRVLVDVDDFRRRVQQESDHE